MAPLCSLVGALLAVAFSAAQTTAPPMTGSEGNSTIAGNGTAVTDDGKYEIASEGIRALFIPYGASISNLFINDTNNVERDIVLGWDNATYYTEDQLHPHYGAVPGRYANRIKNASFELDGMTYNVPANEHAGMPGADALHGGLRGWDWRNWTVTAHTTDSITFSLVDPDGTQGFPGEVISYVTYTLTPYSWHIRMLAIPTEKTTPIMLSSHTYWNLDAFQNPANGGSVLNHTLSLPYSGQRVAVDGNLIPTGPIANIPAISGNDFYSNPKQIGANFTSPDLMGNCGTNCTGYDTCFLVNREAYGPYDWRLEGPVATLYSDFSKIKVDVFSNQDAFQIYSCGSENGTSPLKTTQGTDSLRTVPQYGCVVMEVEDWIDGINYPEWGRGPKQIYGPGGDPYVLEARYDFSVGDGMQASNMGYGAMTKRGPASGGMKRRT